MASMKTDYETLCECGHRKAEHWLEVDSGEHQDCLADDCACQVFIELITPHHIISPQ